MKIIDLLNKIANNKEIPNKIRFMDKIWEKCINDNEYYNKSSGNFLFRFIDSSCLNCEVEVIKNKPEKIELVKIESNLIVFDDKYQDKYIAGCDKISEAICIKLNEVIDKLNYLLERCDKSE